jgi:SAM-dependent methyltransferase
MAQWNHNTYYHKLLLRQLSKIHNSALDIGSGLGLFSFKLSYYFKEVFSLEPDQESIDYSKSKYKSQANIKFINDSFMEYDFKDQQFDFISAIASIHHMDFILALKKMKILLKPGGKIVILGLYRESSALDYFNSITAFFPNLIMSLLSIQKKEDNCEMVTTAPKATIKEIKQVSQTILKNCQYRRKLFWRYILIYENHC